jgi:hypothetical protein
MRPAPPQAVLEIKRLNLEKRLPILVRTSGSGRTGYRKIGAPGSHLEYAEVSPSILVHVETNVFRVMIKDESPKLSSEAPALYELRRKTDEAERTLKRTVKMLDCLEALFFEPFVPPLAGRRSALHEVADELKEQIPELRLALRQLSRAVVPLTGSWGYYVPLLMVVAVAFSQCECHLPVFWQAYSAGRAKGDLKERWPEIDERVLDFIALLIRCQSCYGQLSRGSGDRRFLTIIEEFADPRNFPRELLYSALRVMSVLEDLRHHRISNYAPDAPTRKEGGSAWEEPSWFKLTESCYASLSPKDRPTHPPERFRNRRILRQTLQKRLGRAGKRKILTNICELAGMTPQKRISELFRDQSGATCTWGYASGLNVGNEEMRLFKNYVEENLASLLNKPEINLSQVAMLSFDRTQAADLTKVLADNVGVIARRLNSIRERFQLQAVEIPNFRRGSRPEYVIDVSLNDNLAAEALLFPDRPAPGNPGILIETTAGALFSHLFKLAIEKLDLRGATLHERQNCYVPVPLVRRLLNVTYRLRPETCRSVRITFQPDDFEVVHLPLELDRPEDQEAAQCVAHYIHAVILNRAMSQGFQTCDLDLEGLRNSGWPERITAAYEANGYNVLLESYLGQYNTERESNVQLLYEMQPGFLRRVAVPQLREKLCDFLTQPGWTERKPYVFLGIDIGGTLTKFQFYEFDPGELKFCPKGDTFRILTVPKADNRSAAAVQAEGRNLATTFAARLVKTIADNLGRDNDLCEIQLTSIVAIGLSWPGPVRANRVAGTSGIFKNFPPLSGVIKQNPMEDIQRLDVVGAFGEAWRHLSLETSIALLNDGSADGTGAIYELMPAGRKSENGALAVVKLGTGTAGALFASERLGAGLYEWGKLLLDVGAPPNRDFPTGTANAYLSTRTMPRLARKPPSDLFDVDDLDSLELGLLLEAGDRNFDSKSYERLRAECGIIEFASRGGAARDGCRGDQARPRQGSQGRTGVVWHYRALCRMPGPQRSQGTEEKSGTLR